MTPLKEKVVGKIETPLLVLLGAVGFVLLIACANVVHMLLACAAARQKEIAVRTALGARRGRVIRQFLTENLLLAAVGASAGFLLALWGTHVLVALTPANIPRIEVVSIDAPVVLFLLGITVLTSVLFGVAPAMQASAVNLSDTPMDPYFVVSRIGGVLASIVGALGLLLACMGVYGMVGYSVAQRTRDIGIRVALGAAPSQVLHLILREAMRPVLAGLVIGLAAATAVSRVLAAVLFGLSPLDAISFAGVSLLLSAVALLAGWLPARRAMRVDPMVALRHE